MIYVPLGRSFSLQIFFKGVEISIDKPLQRGVFEVPVVLFLFQIRWEEVAKFGPNVKDGFPVGNQLTYGQPVVVFFLVVYMGLRKLDEPFINYIDYYLIDVEVNYCM